MVYYYGPENNKKKNLKDLTWSDTVIISCACLVFGLWWIALPLLIFKFASEQNKTSNTKKQSVSTPQNVSSQIKTEKVEQREAKERPVVQTHVRKTLMDVARGKFKKNKFLTILMMVIGTILLLVSFLFTMQGIDAAFVDTKECIQNFLSAAFAVCGSGVSFASGFNIRSRKNRIMRYVAVIGTRDAVDLKELATVTNIPLKKVSKDIHTMLEDCYFPEGAYLDDSRDMLFLNSLAAQAYENKEKQAEKPKAPKEAEEGYSGILRQIRRANDAIPDPVLSQKMGRLEEVTAKIFEVLQKHPEREKDVKRFMDYYLPTTQKLLDSYAKFDAAGVEGENLKQAKKKIEDTMDTIVEGFEHQLDELYKQDAMNVDNDIRVMESLLKQDINSVEKDFFGGANATARKEENK